jgi:outer membrane protein assembly factor BamB
LGFVAVLIALPARAENWPQFRGPQANNVPIETQLPSDWGQDKNVQWKFKVAGQGWSSPIIWDNKVFITTAAKEETSQAQPGAQNEQATRGRGSRRTPPDSNYTWEIYCLDLGTGKELWKQVAFRGKPRIATHRSNTYASETPVTDGERIYAYFGMTGLVCYDLDGNFVWKKDLGLYPMQSNWGTASSPLLYGDRLYLQIDNEKESFLVGLDRKTGDQKWRVSRDEKSNWSTPFIWENKSRTELVTVGKKVRSYEVSSGRVLWELSLGGGRCISTPVADSETLYVANEERGGGGTLFAVRAGASGDITPPPGESTSAGVVWSKPKAGIAMASPLLYRGYIYVVDRRAGLASCYDAETGKMAYYRTRVPDGKAFWATPWAYDGKVFCLDEAGTTHVLQAGNEFKVLDTNILNDKFWSSAAISKGSIILRGVNNVYCIR